MAVVRKTAIAALLAVLCATPPLAGADPAGAIPSGPPAVLDTPDGRHLSVSGGDETQLPVAPLTTAITSREYLVSGTFTGTITGDGKSTLNGGTLEVGEQIGCGVIADQVRINPSVNVTPGVRLGPPGDLTAGAGVSVTGKVILKPGTVSVVKLDRKAFTGGSARISVSGVRVKTDRCAGQSFIRSYATLVSSTDNTDDVASYLGVAQVV